MGMLFSKTIKTPSTIEINIDKDIIDPLKQGKKEYVFTKIEINDEAACALAKELKTNTSLEKLHFGGFAITEKGLLELATAIKNHKKINSVCIVCSPDISDKAIILFAMMLWYNTSIKDKNVNGLISSPDRASQSALCFVKHNLLPYLITRNIALENAKTPGEKNRIMHTHTAMWNDSMRKKFSDLLKLHKWHDTTISLNDIIIQEVPSLKFLSIFNIVKNKEMLQKKLAKNDLLPQELKLKI